MVNQYSTNRVPLYKRFWESLDTSQDCWLWTGAKGPKGYGHIVVDTRHTYAHRYSYELANGPIPEGKMVLHKCDNRLCCNPSHLYVGTAADNTADMVRRGRCTSGLVSRFHLDPDCERGELNPYAKLTNDKVRQIRARYAEGGISQAKLARAFSVCQMTIWHIVNRKTWTHI